MEQFMRKYSFYLTSILGIIAVIVLFLNWNNFSMLQKLPIIYIVALALHEIEELKLPGGFVELVSGMTGLELKNPGIAKFGLFVITLYATVIPTFLSELVWPVVGTMLIGVVEAIAHLATARLNKKRFYSPGMITAVFVQFPVSAYGLWYMISQDLIRIYYWPAAFFFVLIPTLCVQGAIVKSNGLSYADFWKNAGKKILGKNK